MNDTCNIKYILCDVQANKSFMSCLCSLKEINFYSLLLSIDISNEVHENMQ